MLPLDALLDVALVRAEHADDQLQRQHLSAVRIGRVDDQIVGPTPLNVQIAAACVPPSMKLR